MSPKPTILYYDVLKYHEQALAFMREHFEVLALPDPGHDTDQALERAEVLMAPLGFPVDRAKLDRCPNLRVVGSSTLSLPHVDVDYASKKGIPVAYLGEEREYMWSITPTAEVAWGLLIAVTRFIPKARRDALKGTRRGRYLGRMTPRMLSNMTLGVIGLGRLGSITASYGAAFGMEVFYYSPNSRNPAYTLCGSLEELARKSDVVSLHAHHLPGTDKMLNADFFAAMKPGSFFINTARGEIVDEDALLEALTSGHLDGAGLDVLAGEHAPGFREKLAESKLVEYARNHDNLVITPHYAGATQDAWWRTQKKTLELILAHLPS